jgi:hypothetical protein
MESSNMYSASGSSGASGSQQNDSIAAFQFGSYHTGSNNMPLYALVGVAALFIFMSKKRGRK